MTGLSCDSVTLGLTIFMQLLVIFEFFLFRFAFKFMWNNILCFVAPVCIHVCFICFVISISYVIFFKCCLSYVCTILVAVFAGWSCDFNYAILTPSVPKTCTRYVSREKNGGGFSHYEVCFFLTWNFIFHLFKILQATFTC